MKIDALVVGAGPVGMTMALELVRHGLSVRIVEQADAPTLYSKAQVVHARTLEILDDMGIVESLIARGKKLRGINVFEGTRRMAHLEIGGKVDSPFPYTLSVSQRDTEIVLEETLRQRGCPVERKVKLERFAREEAGVVATLMHEGGREEEVHASWLLGCDGAHSSVRKGLGMELEGSTYEFRLIQADVRVDMPMTVEDNEILLFLSSDGPTGFFPLPGEKRFRQLVMLQPGVEMEPTLENFQKAIRDRGVDAKVSDPAWMVGFRIHARLAPKLRVGRVFLAGDSSHIHSPAGGQGMNMGMQDSYNLAWKLALVHKGIGRDALLDSYASERHPIHKATLEATDAATRRGTAAMGLKSKLAQAVRNQIIGFVGNLGFVGDAVSRGLSMIDIGYKDSPIVGQHRGSVLKANVMADRTTEVPSLEDWINFGDGPEPGMRAFDAAIGDTSVFELLHGTHHTLLLFDGAAATKAGYENLARIANAAVDRCGAHLRAHVVVPFAERPSDLSFAGSVLLDAEGTLHKRYGAKSECLYLIRPDGHVAFRSQPADLEALRSYLDRILI